MIGVRHEIDKGLATTGFILQMRDHATTFGISKACFVHNMINMVLSSPMFEILKAFR